MTDDEALVIDSEGGEVIAFPTSESPEREQREDERALDEMGLRSATKDPMRFHRRCYHDQHTAVVDAKDRRVTCKGCGATLDPYEVLDTIARRNEELVRGRQRLRHEIGYLEKRVADLKRDERNTKSRTRAAKKRQPIKRRDDGWPLCPTCGEDTLTDRTNPVPVTTGELWCEGCRRVTMRRGRVA